MKIKHFSPFLSVFVLLVTLTSVNAQSTKTSVVLYNSEAYLAEFTTDGQILNLIEKKPNYLKGYDVVKDDTFIERFVAFDPSMGVSNTTLSPGTTVSTKRRFIDFSANYATIDESSMAKLDAIIKYLNNHPEAKVMVTSHRIDDSNKSVKLSDNRIDSCQKYLELKGVDIGRIITASVYAPSLKDKIAISYVNENI